MYNYLTIFVYLSKRRKLTWDSNDSAYVVKEKYRECTENWLIKQIHVRNISKRYTRKYVCTFHESPFYNYSMFDGAILKPLIYQTSRNAFYTSNLSQRFYVYQTTPRNPIFNFSVVIRTFH